MSLRGRESWEAGSDATAPEPKTVAYRIRLRSVIIKHTNTRVDPTQVRALGGTAGLLVVAAHAGGGEAALALDGGGGAPRLVAAAAAGGECLQLISRLMHASRRLRASPTRLESKK